MRRGRLRFWLLWWVSLTVLYDLLVFKTEPAELIAGVLCGAVSATGAELVRSRGDIHFAPRFGWLRVMPALAREVVVDTLRMVPLLWRAARGERVHGRMRCVAFPAAGLKGLEGATRRALETFLGSIAPELVRRRLRRAPRRRRDPPARADRDAAARRLGRAVDAWLIAATSCSSASCRCSSSASAIPCSTRSSPWSSPRPSPPSCWGGHVSDYVTWLVVGTVVLGGIFAVSL